MGRNPLGPILQVVVKKTAPEPRAPHSAPTARACLPSIHAYSVGSRTRVRKVELNMPPITTVASGVPVGWGEPVYDKLDADLAKALMSINAVKGVEIGEGFAAAAISGEENADEMRAGNDGKPRFLSNHAGGILGGPIMSAYPGLDFDMLPLALIVVILGGVGSLIGAFVGSFIIGFVYTFGIALFPLGGMERAGGG